MPTPTPQRQSNGPAAPLPPTVPSSQRSRSASTSQNPIQSVLSNHHHQRQQSYNSSSNSPSQSYSTLRASPTPPLSSSVSTTSLTSSFSNNNLYGSSSTPTNPTNPVRTTTVLLNDTGKTMEVDPYDALTAALVPGALRSNDYRAEFKRFYILALLCYVSAVQGMVWCTFSTVPNYSNKYFFQTIYSSHLLDLLLNWGPIIFLPTALFATWVQTLPSGLRKSVLLASGVCFAANAVRITPTFFSSQTREDYLSYFLLTAHFGQILNAVVLPLLFSSPSKLSMQWFPDDERATATAIAVMSNGAGIGVAYIVGPMIVNQASDIDSLLQLMFVISAIPFVVVLLYYPDRPRSFPSALAAQRFSAPSGALSAVPTISFSRGLWYTMRNRSFCFVMIAGAALTGAYQAWSGILPQILYRSTFTIQNAASLVTVTRFTAILGGLWSGFMADRHFFASQLKPLSCVFLFLSVVFFTIFTLCSPSLAYPQAVFPSDYFFSVISIGMAGFFLGCTTPLLLELGAELTFPAPESTSASLFFMLQQAGTLIMLSVSTGLHAEHINSLMTMMAASSLIFLFAVKEEYKRSSAGLDYRHKNEGVAAVLRYYSTLEDGEASTTSKSYSKRSTGHEVSTTFHAVQTGHMQHSPVDLAEEFKDNDLPSEGGWYRIGYDSS